LELIVLVLEQHNFFSSSFKLIFVLLTWYVGINYFRNKFLPLFQKLLISNSREKGE